MYWSFTTLAFELVKQRLDSGSGTCFVEPIVLDNNFERFFFLNWKLKCCVACFLAKRCVFLRRHCIKMIYGRFRLDFSLIHLFE